MKNVKTRPKKTLAIKMRTQEELKKRIPVFQTEAWLKRKEIRKQKVLESIKKNNKNKK